MGDRFERRRRALAIALLASLLLWNLPYGEFIVYPFKLLATWAHELSHGVVMALTGAGFSHLELYRDTSGIAYAQGGATRTGRAAIWSAGYMGTALFGGALLVVGQTRLGARGVLAALALVLALSAALWIRNDFGFWFAIAAASAFGAGAVFARPTLATYAVNFLAAQLCVHAVLDIRVLFSPKLVVDGQIAQNSDADNMASATFGTPWLWASIWLLWSIGVLAAALFVIHRRERRAQAGAASPRPGYAPAGASGVEQGAAPAPGDAAPVAAIATEAGAGRGPADA